MNNTHLVAQWLQRQIGKNTAIVGKTVPEDYPDGLLASGQVIIKAGEI